MQSSGKMKTFGAKHEEILKFHLREWKITLSECKNGAFGGLTEGKWGQRAKNKFPHNQLKGRGETYCVKV